MSEKRAVVASKNPVKVQAAQQALSQAFPATTWLVEGFAVPSGVAEQPLTETETRLGAENRLNALRLAQPDADFYAAFEGGYDRFNGSPFTFAYVAISNGERVQFGRSATLPLPEQVAIQLEQGGELGPLMDILFNDHNIKQKGGAIGLFTNGKVDRCSTYRDTMTLLLAPFLHPNLF
ncbi:inosine/xanthosine triphosphatase [Ferrimonas lipolytica]|uniref:inosine/xanthosine triphosphatase n=1 Tax=Ferrimonas lipolytica TaxID=2724191 RepID=A0A6H1UFI1_9GAMM|nr:inosine/xanthosine triphosphatase [Ferrimonas lipolytica]QIZ77804.1 inosine/xanthosine triphosphatase [Ferrimonas lipolytica]